MLNIKNIIVAMLMIQSYPVLSDDWIIHTVSQHPFDSGVNNINPGVAYDTGEYRSGVFYNSYKRTSFYTAKVSSITTKLKIGYGVASGYSSEFWDSSPLIPIIAMEYNVTNNLSLIWFGKAINIGVKF